MMPSTVYVWLCVINANRSPAGYRGLVWEVEDLLSADNAGFMALIVSIFKLVAAAHVALSSR